MSIIMDVVNKNKFKQQIKCKVNKKLSTIKREVLVYSYI